MFFKHEVVLFLALGPNYKAVHEAMIKLAYASDTNNQGLSNQNAANTMLGEMYTVFNGVKSSEGIIG